MRESLRRWLESHPRVQIYLDRETYDFLKKRADEMGLTMSEYVRRLIIDARKAIEDAYWSGVRDLIDQKVDLIDVRRRLGKTIEYPRCVYCGKPLHGVIIVKDSRLGEWTLGEIVKAGWHHARCKIGSLRDIR